MGTIPIIRDALGPLNGSHGLANGLQFAARFDTPGKPVNLVNPAQALAVLNYAFSGPDPLGPLFKSTANTGNIKLTPTIPVKNGCWTVSTLTMFPVNNLDFCVLAANRTANLYHVLKNATTHELITYDGAARLFSPTINIVTLTGLHRLTITGHPGGAIAYLDGVFAGSHAFVLNSNIEDLLGDPQGGTTNRAWGNSKEMHVWNRTLGPGEVMEHHQDSFAMFANDDLIAGLLAETPVTAPPFGWFAPIDRYQPSRVRSVESLPALALTPATLPVPISGMAWFAPPERFLPPFTVRLEQRAAFAPIQQLTVPISGMAWFEPLDNRSTAVPSFLHGAPAFGQAIAAPPATGLTWYQPREEPLFRRRSVQDQPSTVFSPQQSLSLGWFVAHLPLAVPIIRAPPWPMFVPRPVVVAAAISGMAWFEPRDADRRSAIFRIGTPPAIALTPSTLPVPIRGMAWFAPIDRYQPTRVRFLETMPALAFTKFHAVLGARIMALSGALEQARALGGGATSSINLIGQVPISPTLDGDPQ